MEMEADLDMETEAQLDSKTIGRLEEQSGLLLRIYRSELAKDPASRATGTSRSNMIALRHTINQIYGKAAALDVANALGCAAIAEVGLLNE
jgi:hypothetical protein